MAKRVFVHVGTPKTGTTYLQSLLWSNKQTLGDQGVLLPLERVRDHYLLSNIARGTEDDLAGMSPRGLGSWDRMLDEVSAWPTDVVISHELFAMVFPPRAEWVIDQLRSVADEIHPMITARDLARQVPAEWQQSIKHGRSYGLREFYELIRAHDPQVAFWRSQELAYQLRMWSQGLPPENVHLITVPPAGGPRDLLWKRYAGVVGVDPSSVDAFATWPNESLGLVEVETLRRVNQVAPHGTSKPLRQLMVRQVLADGILAARPDPVKFAPPAEEHPWVIEYGTAMVDELREIPCDVVGNLDDLLPPAEPLTGPVPDDVDDSAVAAVAVEAISAVLYRSHERETAAYTAEIDRLKTALERRTSRVTELQRRLTGAQPAAAEKRSTPIWRRVAQQARTVPQKARSVVRRVVPRRRS